MDFSIIIAHRGNPMGLWMTIQACELDFQGTDLTREYIVVGNGSEESSDTFNHMVVLKNAGLLAHYSHRKEAMSAPTARQYGTQFATGTYLAFFDNHCLVEGPFFRRAKLDFEKYGMDMLHSSVKYNVYDTVHFQYQLTLNKNFWGRDAQIPDDGGFKPYRIAMAGHGGFLVRRDVFTEVGGYWDGFTGYGGEEPYFDFKMALLDKTNWIDPQLVHIHYVGERGYSRHYSDDHCRNMMMAANIIGGEKWVYKVFNGIQHSTRAGTSAPTPLFDLMVQAFEQSDERARWLASVRHRTFDEQISEFTRQQIAC